MKILDKKKARRMNMYSIFGNFEKRYCSHCAYYNLKSQCNILKRKIINPDCPQCSWYLRKLEGK